MSGIGIIGFGDFGQFMAKHLLPHAEIFAANRSDRSAEAKALGAVYVTHEEAAAQPVVILSTPVQNMEDTLRRIAPHVQPGSLVVDVASVKMKPVELMKRYLPESVEILATHPMFGPQSGKDGIKGLKCVVCDVRCARYERVCHFLREKLELAVIEMTPEEHDRQMAGVQGLTHWIARAVRALDIPPTELATPAYKHFLAIEEMLRRDSMALFYTIERENPFAEPLRQRFLQELQTLEDKIQSGETA